MAPTQPGLQKFRLQITTVRFGVTMALGIVLAAVPLIASVFEPSTAASRLRVAGAAVLVVFFGAAALRAGWFYFFTFPAGTDKNARTKNDLDPSAE